MSQNINIAVYTHDNKLVGNYTSINQFVRQRALKSSYSLNSLSSGVSRNKGWMNRRWRNNKSILKQFKFVRVSPYWSKHGITQPDNNYCKNLINSIICNTMK